MIVMVMGLPGSGKSYFAARLAKAIRADYINSDRLRKMMFGHRTYSAEEKKKVYDEMLLKMQQAAKQNKDLVLDATFHKNERRKTITDKAQTAGPFFLIEVIADESLIKERLKQPREDSEAGFEVYKLIQSEWEPVEEEHLVLQSTDDNINAMLQKALDYLYIKNNDKGPN